MTRNPVPTAPVHVVGAGGLGRETLDALFALGLDASQLVLVDDHPPASELHGVPVRRPEEVTGSGRYVVAVGDPAVRRTLSDRVLRRGLVPISVVHPRATLAHDVTVPAGCLVLANSFVSTNVRLEPHVQVHYNTTVGHDSVLEEFVTVLPGANVAGNVVLHTGVTIGSNSCVLPGLTIGARTLVGAGAVVTRNHPTNQVLVGVPARPRLL